MAYVFAEHRLDVRRRELRCGDQLIDLEPQVFDLYFEGVRAAAGAA
jgi:hypothetical protein